MVIDCGAPASTYMIQPLSTPACKCMTAVIISFTGQCDSLLTDTDTIMVVSGTFPALQGQNITFSCFGNESWLSLCSESGSWDPDPIKTCKGKSKFWFNDTEF